MIRKPKLFIFKKLIPTMLPQKNAIGTHKCRICITKTVVYRVFSHGFAYKIGDKRPEGLLKHKKLLILTTTMGKEGVYKQFGIADAMRTLDEFCWGFFGIRNVEHIFLYEAATNPESRKKHITMLLQWMQKRSGF